MFEHNCPYCTRAIHSLSEGMLRGRFACRHCQGQLVARPALPSMLFSAGLGAGAGLLLGLSPLISVPLLLAIAHPFIFQPKKSQ